MKPRQKAQGKAVAALKEAKTIRFSPELQRVVGAAMLVMRCPVDEAVAALEAAIGEHVEAGKKAVTFGKQCCDVMVEVWVNRTCCWVRRNRRQREEAMRGKLRVIQGGAQCRS